jgi:hypothetical protein
MDTDQDILDQLARKEGGGALSVVAIIASLSLIAGLVGYFTLQLELHSSKELTIDGAALTTIAAIVIFFTAYRKFR